MTRWFEEAFGTALADARRALVEEAWFGRMERPFARSPDGPGDAQSLGHGSEGQRGIHGWSGREDQQGYGWERFLPDPGNEHGIDR
ncbi:MAG: hypothetical protein ACOY45_04555 [Pseudomonadota bacterium]